MRTQPSPTDLVGFHVTPGQLICAGLCLVAIIVTAFWLASRGRSSR